MNQSTENTAKQLANLLGIFAMRLHIGYFRVHACVHITTYLQITVRLANIFFFLEHVCLCVYSKMTEYIIQQEFQV